MKYYILINEVQEGPFSLEDLKDKQYKGELGPETLVWTEGRAGWVKWSELLPSFDVNPATTKPAATPPPLPPVGKAIPPKPSPLFLCEEFIQKKYRSVIAFSLMACCLLLVGVLITSTLCLIKLSSGPEPNTPEIYEYEMRLISRDDEGVRNNRRYDTFGWEYVGPLCNNGLNATYVLFKRVKRD